MDTTTAARPPRTAPRALPDFDDLGGLHDPHDPIHVRGLTPSATYVESPMVNATVARPATARDCSRSASAGQSPRARSGIHALSAAGPSTSSASPIAA